MRLLARVYANGATPSKVSTFHSVNVSTYVNDQAVVVELYEAQIHGEISVIQKLGLTIMVSSPVANDIRYRRFQNTQLFFLDTTIGP